jgi:hypothetical protein
MTRDQKRQRILKLCTEMQKNDEALGRFSDHEGGTDGPTWAAHRDGYLKRRALEALQLHRNAIALWSKLYNLSE